MASRYNRQERIENWDQSKLDRTVALVGLGALETYILEGLIGLGITNIMGFDFDKVELHNLNRQVLFLESDVGRLKCDAMSDRVSERNSEIVFTGFNERITEDNVDILLDEADIVIGALDNVHGRLVISDHVIKHDKIGIHCGTSVFGGEVCTYSRKTPCLRCFLEEPEDELAMSCNREPDPAIVDTNMVIGALAVMQVRNALMPLEGHQCYDPILYYNPRRFKTVNGIRQPDPFWHVPLKKNPNCSCKKYSGE